MMQKRIFLYGLPGVGKSTLAQALARHLGMLCVDLDTEIERQSGLKIPEIFTKLGESGFRDLESAALKDAVAQPPAVVALGGGALLDPQNRRLAETDGVVVCLMAKLNTLLERIGREASDRPLLDESPADRLASLYRHRLEHYLSFERRVDVDNLTIEDLLWDVQTVLGCFYITGMGKSYDVVVGKGLVTSLPDILVTGEFRGPFFVIMDHHLADLYRTSFDWGQREGDGTPRVFTFWAGEGSKTLDTVQQIWKAMADFGMDRGSTCLAFGGGVTGDLTGFAAATFMRGMVWVNLPTSLLAMVDACLGGKTGVDLPAGKNLVGAFHPPGLVLADPWVLDTLPDREFKTGMAEVIKHGVIADPALFEGCKQGMAVRSHLDWIIPRSIAVKARVITQDPYEQGQRAALNFGHTIGHAVEKGMDYRLTHGEAVAIGMVLETWMAERIGLAEIGLSETLAAVLRLFDLPVAIPQELTAADILRLLKFDKKKRAGKNYFALPESIGQVRIDVRIDRLKQLLEERLRK